jgi:nicotinamide-nucleotide amidase
MKSENINAEIITIGDEILIGQIVDTNSAWMAQQLNLIGINVHQITSVSDNKQHIIVALDLAYSRADLILVTGGLGPTKDDLTKQTVEEYFGSRMIRNEQVLEHIRNLLEPRGIKMNELNVGQADLPDNCQVLRNSYGTASGMWFEKNHKIYVFMPGVPYEMKVIVSEELIPKLKQHFNTPSIVHKTLMLQGIAESMLAQIIEPWENQLPSVIKLAYLPSPGVIRLRLTAKGDSTDILTNLIEKEGEKVKPLIKNWYYGDDESIEVTLTKLLKANNKTVATAESCTGGKIASIITSIPGSSDYYKGSIVAYANEIKERFVGVSTDDLANYGAVSQPVVEAMAKNMITLFDVDYSIATSGIAGPYGGTTEKPVGTVWVAVASRQRVISKKFSLGDNNRERNIQRSCLNALNELRKLILQELVKNE